MTIGPWFGEQAEAREDHHQPEHQHDEEWQRYPVVNLGEHEQSRPAHVGGELDDAGFQRGLFRIGRLQALDRIVESLGGLAYDERRTAAFARDVLLPDSGGRGRDDLPQQGARRFRFRTVFGKHLVDQHGVGAELPYIGVLVVVGIFRRSDHQADHQRGQRREKAGAEADGFLGTSLEQVGRQGPFQAHADGRADQDRGKGSQKRGGRTHGVITLSWSRRQRHGGIAYRGMRAWATRDDLLRRNSSGVTSLNRTEHLTMATLLV